MSDIVYLPNLHNGVKREIMYRFMLFTFNVQKACNRAWAERAHKIP